MRSEALFILPYAASLGARKVHRLRQERNRNRTKKNKDTKLDEQTPLLLEPPLRHFSSNTIETPTRPRQVLSSKPNPQVLGHGLDT